MKKLILFGDSLFSNVTKSELLLLEQKLGGEYDVYNCAVGGWNTDDLVKKSSYISRLKPELIMLSVGTNDAAPWKQVELSKFKANITIILDRFKSSRVVFFLPPPINEALLAVDKPDKPFPQKTLKKYYDVAKDICQNQKVRFTESWDLFMPRIMPTDTFHVEDGVHITEEGYDAVFDALVEVLK